MLLQILGRRLKDVREMRGLNQAELAQRVGVSRASISNLEAGKQGLTLETLYHLAHALDTEPRYLLPTLEEFRSAPVDMTDFVERNCRSPILRTWISGVVLGAQEHRSGR